MPEGYLDWKALSSRKMQLVSSLCFLSALYIANAEYSLQQLFSKSQDNYPQVSNGEDIITQTLSGDVERVMKTHNISGLSLAVIRNGQETEFVPLGNRTEDGDKMSSDTLFHMASCSKAFLASALGILMDDFAVGKNTTPLPPGLREFDWETKVKDILPGEWELMDEWAHEKANIRDILSHVSGLPRHDYSYAPLDTVQDIVLRMKHLRPAFELREKYSYNNQMYTLGSHIIFTYAGSYTSFIKERIFDRLNMNSTTFSSGEAAASGKLTQSWTAQGRRIPDWLPEETVELNAGAGGIISNAIDMSRWVETLLNSGLHADANTAVIPRSVFEETTTAHVVTKGRADPDTKMSISGYGMGWERSSYASYEVIFHTGGIPGFSTLVLFLPNHGIGIVILVNSDGKGEALRRVAEVVLQEAMGQYSSLDSVVVQSGRQSRSHTSSSLPHSLGEYAGTYYDPGYGSFTLCTPLSDSFYCREVLSEFSSLGPVTDDRPRLYASWSRMWSTNLRLVHIDAHRFSVQFTAIFAHGFGTDATPFETFEDGLGEVFAEFEVENNRVVGLGIFGTVGVETDRQRWESGVKDKADVWFAKI